MVDFIISLDGYASADGWPGYWGMEGPEYLGVDHGGGRERAHRPHGRDGLQADVRIRHGVVRRPGVAAL